MQNRNNLQLLRWRCHRGMLELDLILLPFFDEAYQNLSEAEKKCFVELLELPDPQLYAWLLAFEHPQDQSIIKLIEQIRQHAHKTL